nr:MAG TPA: hypothetical protein [Microviridae sp.]
MDNKGMLKLIRERATFKASLPAGPEKDRLLKSYDKQLALALTQMELPLQTGDTGTKGPVSPGPVKDKG